MTAEMRSLWATLPGQRLMRLMLEGRVDAKARERFRWLLDRLRAGPGIRRSREPLQLSLFYADPPWRANHGRARSKVSRRVRIEPPPGTGWPREET